MARRSHWLMTPLALSVGLALVLAASNAAFAQGFGDALSDALEAEAKKLPGLEGDSGNGAGTGGPGGGPAIATPTPGVIPAPPPVPAPPGGAAAQPPPDRQMRPQDQAGAPENEEEECFRKAFAAAQASTLDPLGRRRATVTVDEAKIRADCAKAIADRRSSAPQPAEPRRQEAAAPDSEEECFRKGFAAAQASMVDQFGRRIGTITVDEARIRADCARAAADRQFREPPDLTPPPAGEARAGEVEPASPAPPVAGEEPEQARGPARPGGGGQPAAGRPAPAPVAGRPNPALNAAAYDVRVADGLKRLGVAPRATIDGQPIYRGFSPSIARAFGLSEQTAIVAGAYQEGVPAERIMRELNLTPEQLSEHLDTYFRTAQGVTEAGVRARMIADYLGGAPAGAARTSG